MHTYEWHLPPRKRRRGFWFYFFLFSAVVLVSGALGYYSVWLEVRPQSQTNTSGLRVAPLPLPNPVRKPSFLERHFNPFFPDDTVMVLVLGTDGQWHNGRSDTMILLLVDLREQQAGVLSLPRDTRVVIPGHGWDKINAACAYGGPQLALKTVRQFLRTNLKYYLHTDLAGFKELVDAVGGVELEVEKRMRYRDRAQGLYIDLHPGWQHLDGDKAMQYVRFRHDSQGDLGRIVRQQKFLKAFAKRALAPQNLTKLPQILAQLREHVETNLTLTQILYLARRLQQISLDKVVTTQLPTTPRRINGLYYLIPQLEGREVLADLWEQIREAHRPPRVLVCNGSNILGATEKVARKLREAGFEPVLPPEELTFPAEHTTVIDLTEKAEAARKIAALVGGTVSSQEKLELKGQEIDVDLVVVLGADYRRPSG
ncbi:MAG TPA: LytR family transcriptional regulator [Armatimonadetes bacterium]|nr:LytR family transcriptional regulator [Armatimonadota bacterium]